MNQGIKVVLGDWGTCKKDASAVRHDVFVTEQGVPVEIEMDKEDPYSTHAVAYDEQGEPIGTGRLLRDGHIGRMAVRPEYRGRGVGSLLLSALVDEARRHRFLEVALSAQTHARHFYESRGFVAEGQPFLEAGIPHVTMRHSLTA